MEPFHWNHLIELEPFSNGCRFFAAPKGYGARDADARISSGRTANGFALFKATSVPGWRKGEKSKEKWEKTEDERKDEGEKSGRIEEKGRKS